MGEWIESFDAQLHITPPLTDQELGQIPAKRGVFALLGEDDTPIVLLPAANMRARLKTRLSEPLEDRRRRTADLREITRKVIWKLTSSHFETDLIYFGLARRMWVRDYWNLLSWKPGWFVHVDPEEEYPRFARTRDVSVGSGQCFGPFRDGRSANHFIGAIEDAFDLCRDYRCLRRAPRAERCSYGQMGRCLCPCDGTISMGEYRKSVVAAALFVAGNREPLRRRLEEQMSAASRGLQFERAAALKQRLERLTEFDHPEYRFVAPLEDFRYLFVERSGVSSKAKIFLVCGGQIAPREPIEYPLRDEQIAGAITALTALSEDMMVFNRAAIYRMGLVIKYLFSAPKTSGLIVRWERNMSSDDVSKRIESATDLLALKIPKRKKRASGARKQSE